jgi:hypothetical protein
MDRHGCGGTRAPFSTPVPPPPFPTLLPPCWRWRRMRCAPRPRRAVREGCVFVCGVWGWEWAARPSPLPGLPSFLSPSVLFFARLVCVCVCVLSFPPCRVCAVPAPACYASPLLASLPPIPHTRPPPFSFLSAWDGWHARARGRANAHTLLPPFIPLSHPPPRCLPPFSRGAGVGALCGDWGRGAGVRAPRCPPPLPPVCVVGFHLLKNQKKMKKGRTFCPRTRRVFVFCGRTLLERARACVCEGVALCNTQKEAPRGPVFFF